MKNVSFKETQQYKNKFVLIILGVVVVIALVKGTTFLWDSEPKIERAIFLYWVAIAIGILIWWMTKLKLKVAITEKKINFKLSPIHLKKHAIHWKEIDKCEIVVTSEAAQWAGSNINFNHEKSYSLTGRNGLAILTKKGEYFFIGCTDMARLQKALHAMNFSK